MIREHFLNIVVIIANKFHSAFIVIFKKRDLSILIRLTGNADQRGVCACEDLNVFVSRKSLAYNVC